MHIIIYLAQSTKKGLHATLFKINSSYFFT